MSGLRFGFDGDAEGAAAVDFEPFFGGGGESSSLDELDDESLLLIASRTGFFFVVAAVEKAAESSVARFLSLVVGCSFACANAELAATLA